MFVESQPRGQKGDTVFTKTVARLMSRMGLRTYTSRTLQNVNSTKAGKSSDAGKIITVGRVVPPTLTLT